MLAINKAYNIDCMQGMPKIKDKSIDLILSDLPYGITNNKWDKVIPLQDYVEVKRRKLCQQEYLLHCYAKDIDVKAANDNWEQSHIKGLWHHYKRILKDNGVVVLTAFQPFTTKLIVSNAKMFKYSWVWHKSRKTNFLQAKRQPLRQHEDILVFCCKSSTYNPQGLTKCVINHTKLGKRTGNYAFCQKKPYIQTQTGYPASVLKIANPNHGNIHPTQKPVELGRYLIKTYSNKGDIVLDNVCGSGSFLVAAMLEQRQFIGFELDKEYFKKLQLRLRKVKSESK